MSMGKPYQRRVIITTIHLFSRDRIPSLMLKKLITLVTLVTATTAFAGPFDLFLVTLKKEFYFTKTDKASQLNHTVFVTEFGPIGRVFNKDAAATYNDRINMISLDPSLLDGGMIKSAQEIMGKNYDSSRVSTVFHEMGHAEMDTLVENDFDLDDLSLHTYYKNTLKNVYKTYFPDFNAHMMLQEHFGYYRGELIDFFSGEVNQVLTDNGFNRFANRCFLSQNLKQKLKEGVSLGEYTKLMNFQKADEFYRLKIGPQYIFVRGKDIDLSKAPKHLIAQAHLMFWSYHQAGYNFPMTRSDLVKRMNISNRHKRTIADCRTKQWNDYHSKK